MRNIIVTGIPRTGTTLACALIDSMPDCVCLNEPHWQVSAQLGGDAQALAFWLQEDFARLRGHLLAEHPVPDRRNDDGRAITNFFRHGKPADDHSMTLFIRAGLTPQFTLAMKHNALYLAALPYLARMSDFTVIAIIRHPVATLASWRRVALPVNQGRMPHAAIYWPEVKAITDSHEDALVKQVKLYDTICARLHELKGTLHILPYETMVEKPEKLCEYLQHDGPVDNTLIEHEITAVTQQEQHMILEALHKHGSHWQKLYPHI
ncbi:MAG: sulfotransferase [Alphaproteobacteria bacterium]